MRFATPLAAAEFQLWRLGEATPANPSTLAALETLCVQVERHCAGRCVLGATFQDASRAARYLILLASRADDGRWAISRTQAGLIDERPGPPSALLYVLETSLGATNFAGYAPGAKGDQATHVRLTATNKHTLDIPVADRWAVSADEIQLTPPVEIDLLDASGAVIWTDTAE